MASTELPTCVLLLFFFKSLFKQPLLLVQSSKVLAKHELLKVPLIGWTWYFLEIVFCKRKWEEDRKTVFSGLNRLKDYPECMWVGIRPPAPPPPHC